jgi:hypothetical protein
MALNYISRRFTHKIMASPRQTVVDVPSNFVGERLDKYLMNEFKITWTASNKIIRTKKAFIYLPDEAEDK